MKPRQARSKACHWPLQCHLSPVPCAADIRPEWNSRVCEAKVQGTVGLSLAREVLSPGKLKEPLPTLSKTILNTFTKAYLACLCPRSSCSHILLSQQFWTGMECPAHGTVWRTKPTLHCPIPDALVMTSNQRLLEDPTNPQVWVLVLPLFPPLPL